MNKWEEIINKYYGEDSELRRILVVHSQSVAQKALQIVSLHPELNLDRQFVEEAAMLHDIGIIKTDAPGIQCFGTEPYICHGILGAEMLRNEGLPRHARVCERHTGAGLSLADIESRDLPFLTVIFFPKHWKKNLYAMPTSSFQNRISIGRNLWKRWSVA